MKKVFLDTDVILDLLLERDPFFYSPLILFEKAERNEIELYASAVCFTNLFYILRKAYTSLQTYKMLNEISLSVNILTVDARIIKVALISGLTDFEDSVQYFTAFNNSMDVIITRNTKDFKISKIPVMTAEEFLKSL